MVVMKNTVFKYDFYYFIFVVFLLTIFTDISEGAIKKCFVCRSRGDLGSCKDPFKYGNYTSLDDVKGISAVPCPSGWCNKVLEGGANQFKDEEYGAATSRACLQRGPPDNEERCAMTTLGTNPAPVMMCLCQGDLCNGSPSTALPSVQLILIPVLSIYYVRTNFFM